MAKKKRRIKFKKRPKQTFAPLEGGVLVKSCGENPHGVIKTKRPFLVVVNGRVMTLGEVADCWDGD